MASDPSFVRLTPEQVEQIRRLCSEVLRVDFANARQSSGGPWWTSTDMDSWDEKRIKDRARAILAALDAKPEQPTPPTTYDHTREQCNPDECDMPEHIGERAEEALRKARANAAAHAVHQPIPYPDDEPQRTAAEERTCCAHEPSCPYAAVEERMRIVEWLRGDGEMLFAKRYTGGGYMSQQVANAIEACEHWEDTENG